MPYLYVNVLSSCETDDFEFVPTDDWDRPDSVWSHYIEDVRLKENPRFSYEHVPVDFEPQRDQTVYLVHAVWSTGDSFGHDRNRCNDIVAVYTNRESADEDAEILRGSPNHKRGLYLLSNGLEYYAGWHGYFEHLEYIEVIERIVE